MKEIVKNRVVTLSYEATDTDGNVLDAGEAPLSYLHGGYGDIFAAIEAALQGKSVGDTVTIKMQPAQAYGEYDADLVLIESLDVLPQPLTIGMQIEGEPDGESEEAPFYTVTDIADGKAVLDGNHPLAGMALVFTGTVTAVRPASPAEIEAGQAR
ncbi:MAG: peptidylprolyl isomerase [Desulfuromonadales bacterium]|nr:peptidylprolyl isomerase [Desulfuromonadales bacterium]